MSISNIKPVPATSGSFQSASAHDAGHRYDRRQSGIGLIEILVAVIILAIGFLATARMQVQGMRAGEEAYVRSQATFLLKDMADRMRSNPAGVEAGYYDGLSTLQNIQPSSCVAPGANATCSPAMITQNDLAEWTAYLVSANANFIPLLPSTESFAASGSIERTGDLYNISVVWGATINGEEVEQSLALQILP